MATTNYNIDYNDKRFTEVEADKKAALNEVDVTYGNMISQSDQFYQAQIDAANNYAEQQKQIQQQQTDFAIEKIEQQKAQAKQDYTKEQSGAYVDWQKQSNQYGANAEQIAAQGMTNTGYSESSQVSMYNTYQNRVATARESYNRAVLNYDNAIKDARLQNNAALAEIAYQALQTQLELSLEGFQYKNQLLIAQSDKKMEVENNYYNRYQDVLNQINHENALAEEIRQYEQNYAEDVRQYNASLAEEQRQYNQSQALKEKEYNEGVRQFNEELKLAQAQLAEEKRQFEIQNKQNQDKIVNSGGGGGGSSNKSSGKASVTKRNTNTGTSGIVKSGQATNVSVYESNTPSKQVSAADYLNKLIASGASKSKVSAEISKAQQSGAITKQEAAKLRSTFTPRGHQY